MIQRVRVARWSSLRLDPVELHIVGFEPTLSYLRKWIMSPSLSTTQPYMPFRIYWSGSLASPKLGEGSLVKASPWTQKGEAPRAKIKAIKTDFANQCYFVAEGKSESFKLGSPKRQEVGSGSLRDLYWGKPLFE